MALGLREKSAERLGVKVSDIDKIAELSPYGYNDWIEKRDAIEEAYPSTARWINQCFNVPGQDEIIMSMLDELLEGHGVEVICVGGEWVDSYHHDIVASYVNMGDTYDTTVVLDHRSGRYLVTSWGDFVEGIDWPKMG